MVYVGSKRLNVNFTVHKVERLNLKERTCRRSRDSEKELIWVFEFSLPMWVRPTFYISAAWFGLLLIFSDGGHHGFSRELKDPEKSCLDTFPQAQGSVHRLQGSCQMAWLVRKGSACGDLYPPLFAAKSQLSEGKGCSLSPHLVFLVMILWLRLLYRSGCSVTLDMPEDIYYQFKKFQSVKKNTSHWALKDISCFWHFPSFNGLWCFFYPFNRGYYFFVCGFLKVHT